MTSTETGLGIEAKSDAIYELVEEGSKVERVATGFTFTEGPIWHPTEHYLLFSDMPGDVRRKYTPDGTVVEVRNFSNKCNGMTYDADLNLLVCEHVTSSLVRESPDGSREIIAQEFEGEELNSPNDVCVHSSGAIYFSDPWYGRFPGFGHPRKRRLGFQGVYRIAPGGGDLGAHRRQGRVRDAERHLLQPGRDALLHQRHARGVHQGLRLGRGRERSRTAACSSRASAPASSRRASRTG